MKPARRVGKKASPGSGFPDLVNSIKSPLMSFGNQTINAAIANTIPHKPIPISHLLCIAIFPNRLFAKIV